MGDGIIATIQTPFARAGFDSNRSGIGIKQVSALWHDALAAYFDPSRFTIALQNCITTSRTVTFILQSHKTAVPGFDDWYGAYQRKFAADPVIVWARDARNKIEKRGDLEMLSQIRAELIAAYSGNPVTDCSRSHACIASCSTQ
jgi:hypothetical protein